MFVVSSAADVAILNCQFAAGFPDPACCAGVTPETYPIVDPLVHLTCYDIEESAPPPANAITVSNQFGIDQPLDIGGPKELCVPT